MTKNTDPQKRKAQTGEPTKNKGEFGSKTNHSPEVSLDTEGILRSEIIVYDTANRRIGLASARLVSERILAVHPTARYLELEAMSGDTGFFGGKVLSSDGDHLGDAEDLDDSIGLPLTKMSQGPKYKWDSATSSYVKDSDDSWLLFDTAMRKHRLDLLAAKEIVLL